MTRTRKSFHSEGYRSFQRKLQVARAEVKLTQRQAAAKLELPRSYISKIETGARRVDVVELKALAKLYKKPMAFFLND